jgi:hypothetical protein
VASSFTLTIALLDQLGIPVTRSFLLQTSISATSIDQESLSTEFSASKVVSTQDPLRLKAALKFSLQRYKDSRHRSLRLSLGKERQKSLPLLQFWSVEGGLVQYGPYI